MLIKIREQLKRQQGFTLVELMIVIAILGILATIAVPRISNSIDTAKVAKIQTDLQTIGSAVSLYMANNSGAFPPGLTNLVPNQLASVPHMPDGGNYSYDNKTGVASGSFNSKTYYSDGTTTTP